MILRLTVDCVWGAYLKEQCIRVIEIDADDCLYDLHVAIQDAVHFGQDHLYEFYLANSSSSYAVKKRLTEHENWEDRESDFFRIRLADIWPTGRKKLYYLFDFGDMWTFEIRKARGAKEPEHGVTYPRVIQAIGPDPEQYPRFDGPMA